MNDPTGDTLREEYRALVETAACCPLADRGQIELRGGDRASFLHNLCTADIKRLEAGRGCEAFLCNVQGKIVGYAYVFATADTLVLETAAGQNEPLLRHLDRYLIREDVELRDHSDDWSQWLLSGPESPDLLRNLGVERVPQEYLEHVPGRLGETEVFVRRTNWTCDPAFFLAGPRERMEQVGRTLREAGARQVESAAREIARVERGAPVYGIDITERNLPQEVDRNELAISFVKGCYLGQETVARIDALGHVNWYLRGLRSDDVPPEAARGKELTVDGKTAARLGTAVFSPRLDATLALGYVRRGEEEPGTRITSEGATWTVVALPLKD